MSALLATNYNGIWDSTDTPYLDGSGTGSFVFDGNSHLTVANNGVFAPGTSDFTIEWWQKQGSFSDGEGSNHPRPFSVGSYPAPIAVSIEGGSFYYWNGGANYFGDVSTGLINTWNFFRIVRSAGVTTVYRNGSVLGSPIADNADISDTSDPLYIGAELGPQSKFIGKIANFRWQSVATANPEVVPTSNISDDSDTVFSLNADNFLTPTPTLYYTNASGDYYWENLLNWNTVADGSGDTPTNIPWTDDGSGGAWYGDYDLVQASGTSVTIHNNISSEVSGSCNIPTGIESGNVYGGTFTANNCSNHRGVIYGGLFTGNGFYLYSADGGTILGGTFSGDNFYANGCNISGGNFTGKNSFFGWGGNISNVSFNINGITIYQVPIDYSSVTINYDGVLYTGYWQNQYWLNGNYVPSMYYNNAQGDGDWGNLLNWWQNETFSLPATNLPTASSPVNIYSDVTQNTQGADQCLCTGAILWSSYFGAGLTLQSAGDINLRGYTVFAGTMAGNIFMHDESQIADTGTANGAVVLRNGATNAGAINGTAVIYYDGGAGHFPIGGSVTGSITYLNFPEGLYFTNGGGDRTWGNIYNWQYLDLSNPTEVPWTEADGSTSALNLVNTSGVSYYPNVIIDQTITISPYGGVSGVCGINSIANTGNIYGGTFTGSDFSNAYYDILGPLSGSIYGGLFTGNNWANNYWGNQGTFYDGIVTGNSSNNGGTIYYGYFSGGYFFNNSGGYGNIYGGHFANNYFENAGYCNGIIFTGNGFYNDQGAQVVNCDFSSGTGFSDWGVQGCYFHGDGTLSQNGKNYTYNGEFAAITYPISAGGTANTLDLARLIGLPPFIKL